MRNIIFTLTFLACVAHARRVQGPTHQSQGSHPSRRQKPFKVTDVIYLYSAAYGASTKLSQVRDRVSRKQALNSLRELASLLLASDPKAVFISSGPAIQMCNGNVAATGLSLALVDRRSCFRNRLCHHARLSEPLKMMAGKSGRVAVVTGATRGIGRAIAIELGREGHTVYCIGRSVRGNQTTERAMPEGLDLTVESTAEAVDAAGGTGHAMPCDLSSDEAVDQVLSKISEAENGKVDILVCSAFQTPPGKLRAEFWTQGMDMWDSCNGVGLRGVYNVCRCAVPMLISSSTGNDAAPPPLVVLVSSFGGKAYTFNVAYGVGKCAVDRLATDMSYQLKKHGVGTVSLYPGTVKTEGNLEMEKQGTWDEASGGLDLLGAGETPKLSGKAVCALARLGRDELFSKYSGKTAVVAELAKELGYAEDDGSVPPSIRSLKFLLPGYVFPQIEKESGKPIPAWVKNNVPDLLLPWSVFSDGPPPEPDS